MAYILEVNSHPEGYRTVDGAYVLCGEIPGQAGVSRPTSGQMYPLTR